MTAATSNIIVKTALLLGLLLSVSACAVPQGSNMTDYSYVPSAPVMAAQPVMDIGDY